MSEDLQPYHGLHIKNQRNQKWDSGVWDESSHPGRQRLQIKHKKIVTGLRRTQKGNERKCKMIIDHAYLRYISAS